MIGFSLFDHDLMESAALYYRQNVMFTDHVNVLAPAYKHLISDAHSSSYVLKFLLSGIFCNILVSGTVYVYITSSSKITSAFVT